MRLPALRLPMSTSGRFEGMSGRRFLLYTLYTAVLFALFLAVNFPYDVIVQRALREVSLGPVHVQVAATRFAWFNGWELRRVQLIQDATESPVLESPSVYVRPGLSGLWAGKLSSLYAKADIYGGKVHAKWVAGGDIDRTNLQFDHIQIGLNPFLNGLLDEGQLAGLVGGVATVEDHHGDLRAGRAAGEIQLQHANLTGAKINGIGVPDLHFETVALKFEYEGGQAGSAGAQCRRGGVEDRRHGAGGPGAADPEQHPQPAGHRPARCRGPGRDPRPAVVDPALEEGAAGRAGGHRGHVEQAALSLIRRFRRSSARQPRNPVRSTGGSSVPLARDFR